MASSLPSDEVAEDYKNALDDLVTNDRYQIANLTMIAKENIEHAEAISRVLTNHINRTSPSRKLPALYVLDSLVKNIGSPYTIYFGRNLHSTFMLAYSQVDAAIRRKLEEMLRTWREPIPGSLSTTPVFPLQSTQSVVDTLNRYKASTAPSAQRIPVQQSGVKMPNLQHYRNTPTPPQVQPAPQNSVLLYASQPEARSVPSLQAQAPFNTSQHRPSTSSSVDLARLHADIDDLTTDAKIECATHPMDSAAQRKLTTLQTLKELLDSGSTSEQDLVDIRSTIRQEMEKKLANQQPIPNATQPQYAHQPPVYHQISAPVAPPSFINQANLAELLRATSAVTSTPPLQPPQTAPYQHQNHSNTYNTPPVAPAVPVSIAQNSSQMPVNSIPFLDQLRASGLLSATSTPPQNANAIPNLASLLSSSISEVSFTSASIRIARPQLIIKFADARPNQCSTCGRRFSSDDTGRERKARHLDWHFKTKARMLEAEKRGQNRSWYVDEREWIANKDFEDDAGTNDPANGNVTASDVAKKEDYVRAPSDPVLRNAPCPVDQEPFKSEWSEEVQDFIWKDAIRVGNRYYHASCYREVTKDRDKDSNLTVPSSVATRTATPDSVLGKRKAEAVETSANMKVKLEA